MRTALLLLALVLAVGCGTDCKEHEDCPEGEVCLFGRDTCARACNTQTPCPATLECNSCASSSCPVCNDCLSACVPPR